MTLQWFALTPSQNKEAVVHIICKSENGLALGMIATHL